jgi:methionyl-tRNA synthetase
VDQLVHRANKDLANGLGEVVDRIVVMVHRYREDGHRPSSPRKVTFWRPAKQCPNACTKALEALALLLFACRTLANELTPFVPTLVTRIAEQCFSLSGTLAPPQTLFPDCDRRSRPRWSESFVWAPPSRVAPKRKLHGFQRSGSGIAW